MHLLAFDVLEQLDAAPWSETIHRYYHWLINHGPEPF